MSWLRVAGIVGIVALAAAPLAAQELEREGRTLIYTSQPMDLPALAMVMDDGESEGHEHGHEGIFPPVETVTIPVHGYLKGFEYEVVDREGNILDRSILHHFNVIDPDHRELFLPISQRILAAGKETGDQSMPGLLLGVPVYAGQRLVFTTMLHNPTGVEQLGVSLRVKLNYTPVGRPWPFFEVFPFQVDVAFPAGDKSFDLPAGESTYSWEGSPSTAGRIMVLGSHFHEMATKITLEDLTEDKVLWEGFPKYDEEGTLEGVTIGHAYWRGGIKITPDRRYRVTVYYNNTTGRMVTSGGMGVVGGVFMPSRGGPWPRADVTNPLYALDRSHYMREVRGEYEVIVGGGGVQGASHDHEANPAATQQDTPASPGGHGHH